MQARKLMDKRRIRHNINEAIDLMRDCKFVMGLAAKAMEQIEAKKYFSALKVGRWLTLATLAQPSRQASCFDPLTCAKQGCACRFTPGSFAFDSARPCVWRRVWTSCGGCTCRGSPTTNSPKCSVRLSLHPLVCLLG